MSEVEFLYTVAQILIKNVDTSGNNSCKVKGALQFDSAVIPPIGIGSYIHRLNKYFECSDKCNIIALIYLERFAKACDNFTLTVQNVHRLYLVSVLVAIKFWEDTFYNNAYYARCGGVCTLELNRLEYVFLNMINFNLWISGEEFIQYLSAHGLNVSVELASEMGSVLMEKMEHNESSSHSFVLRPVSPSTRVGSDDESD